MSKTPSHNTIDPLVGSILRLQKKRRIFPPADGQNKQPLVVGVSGGADSVCLLHLLWTLSTMQPDSWPFSLHVAHFDHGLRAESGADAEFVQALAKQFGVACSVEKAAVDLACQVGGVESAARHARYRFLSRVVATVTPPAQDALIIVAHNADDQAETVLMNFIRGSGLDGLGGMDFVMPLPVPVEQSTVDRSIKVVRPLLETPRAEIDAYLARHTLRWREDRSNSDKKFLRNRLRGDVMPLLKEINPDLLAAIGRNAQIARSEAERINALDATVLDNLIHDVAEADAIHLNIAQLRGLNGAALRNVVRLALHRSCYDDGEQNRRRIGFAVVEQIVDVVHSVSLYDQLSEIVASGPHPLVNDICWTVQPANQFVPAILSLHRSDSVPQIVDQPRVAAPFALAREGSIESANGWILRSETLPLHSLPADWRSQPRPWEVYLDSGCVDQPQLTSLAATVDRTLKFAPLGMDGRHKSSLGDFFTDRKIAPALRTQWPLIVEAQTDRVLWVCGLQPGHHARITDATKQVLHLWWEKK